MKLSSHSIQHNQAIDPRFAFGKMDKQSNIALSSNINPHFSWTDAPEGTKSFVMVCVDTDVPSKPDDVNQLDREVPADLPRVEFYHWALIDIPADVTEIKEGEHSKDVTPKGKGGPSAPGGLRHGINNFTEWFAGDPDMKGDYFGYDGPCPPFNDSLVHHYHFTLYALDIERLPLEGNFKCADVVKAMAEHVLAEATITGTYTLNPRLAES